MWDQNYRYNLKIRKALEHIYQNYKGDKSTEDWENFEVYLKCGFQTESTIIILMKIQPNFSESYFSF
jgi:dipeptidyl-peptidase-3